MIIIVMGVSGCGKSTIGKLLSERLCAQFLDADDLHPAENKQRMSAGIPLTDADRLPWLNQVKDYALTCYSNQQPCIIACSALKKSYRQILNQAPSVQYVFLDGTRSVIRKRLEKRTGHFMPERLLDSQFDTLELPIDEENVLSIAINGSPDQVTNDVLTALKRANII